MIRWIVLAAALLLVSCGPRDTVARPALWRVSDGDTEIWLLGTIHALPPRVAWKTPAVADVIARADTLVTEVPPVDPARAGAGFLAAARRAGLPPLVARVGAEYRVALAPFGSSLDGMQTWGAAVMIGARGMQAAGAAPAYGVEAVLARDFAGRRHVALETQEGQLAFFDALPEAAQRVLLERALTDPQGYATTLAAWVAGDVDSLAASFAPAFADAPVLRAVLVTRRNAAWSRWIAARMGRPGRVLVAVGAGHLVGDGSVVAMLSRAGVRVERVE